MNKEELEHLRHSLAHLLAAAVLELWPDAKRAIGPSIENGFYYDFEFPTDPPTEDNLHEIEDRMKEILRTWRTFERQEISLKEAKGLFANDPYKLELIDEYAKEGLTLYKSGEYVDLCRGGHVDDAEKINPDSFKLTHIAGAYWRGNEKNKMLTRIYGVAFSTKKELDEYLLMEKEAKKRDHRKLGRELKLFAFSDFVGPGLPLWLPNGTIVIEELEKLAKKTELDAGYKQVRTPHIAKEIMYKTSGHLPYYAESMFPPMVVEENGEKEIYYLKAMNCPHHHQIYAAEQRSYRDLPLRLSEYGVDYRYEKSGELFGLMRVRMLSMNDAHIYCTEEQFESEFKAVNELYLNYFKIFGFNKYIMRFSTHDPKELGKKYVDNPELWEKTENMVRKVLDDSGIEFVEVKNEAAFYGPKIDVQVWSSIGKEFTIATNQVDFAVPERFGLTFIDQQGNRKTPIVIHRAPLGTHERTIGFLIEHFAGVFPLWLSPVQVMVLPISDKFADYAKKISKELKEKEIRIEIDERNESIGKKIREAEMQKVPYILVVGEKEKSANTVAVRKRGEGDLGQMETEEFIKRIKKEIESRI